MAYADSIFSPQTLLFGKYPSYQNPADSGMQYLDKVPDILKQYYNPYIKSGQDASKTLQNQYGQMINDPNAIYNKISSGYTQSPGYQFKLSQALMAGDNAAAAGGMAGSPMHQQQNMQLASDISSQDFNNWLSQVLGVYGQGIAGEEGFNKMGYDSSTELGTDLAKNYGNEAELAYKGTGAQNEYNQAKYKSNSDFWGTLLGSAAGAFMK